MSSQMNPTEPRNPYAAPVARVERFERNATKEVAGRGTRLVAAIIDGAIWVVPYVIVLAITGIMNRQSPGSTSNEGVLGFFGLFMLLIGIVDLVLVFQSQQTIGKKIMGIRIVRFDHGPCNPWRILFLRGFVPTLIGAIPLLGGLFSLLDPLMIFRDDNRCVHDHIADTIVVRA